MDKKKKKRRQHHIGELLVWQSDLYMVLGKQRIKGTGWTIFLLFCNGGVVEIKALRLSWVTELFLWTDAS